ncbi:hypothetical protein KP79_PYT24802 [Mizuhopecten yessoensis]|nr:hypothetical protein KP79_PYT24802 [Mizuhopecten yessoensis]
MKLDLLDSDRTREITIEEATKFSREINSNIDISHLPKDPYFETSSLKGSNVTEVFEYIFNHCVPLTDAEKRVAGNTGIVDLSKPVNDGAKDKKKCC